MRPSTRRTAPLHQDWLAQVETDGPFLSLPVLKDIWPNGMDRLGDTDDRLVSFKEGFAEFERAYDRQQYAAADGAHARRRDAWVDLVLDELAEWEGLRVDGRRSPGGVRRHLPGRGDHRPTRRRPAQAQRRRAAMPACCAVVPSVASLHDAGTGRLGGQRDRPDGRAAPRQQRRRSGSSPTAAGGRLVWAGEGTTDGLRHRRRPDLARGAASSATRSSP